MLYVARDRAGVTDLARKTDWLADRYGYREGRLLEAAEVAEITGSSAFTGGRLDLGAGYCNPLAYARGLAQAARAAGARLHEGSPVIDLTPGAPHRVQTAAGTVIADHVILAANGYHDRLVGRFADHVLPINNYIAATAPLGHRAPLTRPHAITDDRFVVNYWWQTPDTRLIYGGGESYGRRFPTDIAAKVRRQLARVYPDLADVALTHAWGGTLAVTANRLPFAAELAPGLLSVGGYSGHGLALAGLAGRAMAEKIQGDGIDFDRLARLPAPRLPGGRWLGPLIAGAGMAALSLRDRLGF